ncbi:MAG: P-II family nitrogen regulator [Nitrosopumilus sp.]
MKKIEAIIKRKNFPIIRTNLNSMGTYIIDKRNLDDSNIYNTLNNLDIDCTNLKSIPLAKIEMVVSNKNARRVVDIISKHSGLLSNSGGKIFISEMEEVNQTDTISNGVVVLAPEEQPYQSTGLN